MKENPVNGYHRGTFDQDFIHRFCNFRQDGPTPDLQGVPMTFEAYRQRVERYTPGRPSPSPAGSMPSR